MNQAHKLEREIDELTYALLDIEHGGPFEQMEVLRYQVKKAQEYKQFQRVNIINREFLRAEKDYAQWRKNHKQEHRQLKRQLSCAEFDLATLGMRIRPLHKLKTYDLIRLPQKALDIVVFSKYGVKHLNFGTNSAEEYRYAVIHYITYHGSCSFCHNIFHKINQCHHMLDYQEDLYTRSQYGKQHRYVKQPHQPEWTEEWC